MDLQSLTLHGRPLAAWRPTVHTLDWNPPPSKTPSKTTRPQHARPRSARGGGQRSRRQPFEAPGPKAKPSPEPWPPRPRRPPLHLAQDTAARAQLTAALPDAPVFHYAGHGQSGERLQSVLRLAQDTKLTTADILALLGVPRRVMLSACEGAATRDQDGGVTLADAFITAGAEAVVAGPRGRPRRPGPDSSVALYKTALPIPTLRPRTRFSRPRRPSVKLASPCSPSGCCCPEATPYSMFMVQPQRTSMAALGACWTASHEAGHRAIWSSRLQYRSPVAVADILTADSRYQLRRTTGWGEFKLDGTEIDVFAVRRLWHIKPARQDGLATEDSAIKANISADGENRHQTGQTFDVVLVLEIGCASGPTKFLAIRKSNYDRHWRQRRPLSPVSKGLRQGSSMIARPRNTVVLKIETTDRLRIDVCPGRSPPRPRCTNGQRNVFETVIRDGCLRGDLCCLPGRTAPSPQGGNHRPPNHGQILPSAAMKLSQPPDARLHAARVVDDVRSPLASEKGLESPQSIKSRRHDMLPVPRDFPRGVTELGR